MRTITKLVPLVLLTGVVAVEACGSIPNDTPQGREYPIAGVIRGTVTYVGPPPCSQNGHVVGNVVLLVFDRRNPPAPVGLGTTAANFGVVSGDVLFHDWPVTTSSTKTCPDSGYPDQTVSAPFTIAPMAAGSYNISAFFDYTGDFFATFKFRQLPEALDVGGGAIDLNDANSLKPNFAAPPVDVDGGLVYPLIPKNQDPNYLPKYLNIDVGIPADIPADSLRGVPNFIMPETGYIADNVQVFIGARLPLARPYFYPQGSISPANAPNTDGVVIPSAASADVRPTDDKTANTSPQNPTGDRDFVPVLSFPQDISIFAQPVRGIANQTAVAEYQGSFPTLTLRAGLPAVEQAAGGNVSDPSDPFHMQLGTADSAPGGNGGIFVWWDGTHIDSDCAGIPGCNYQDFEHIPETPLIPRFWPLVVLAKLNDLPQGASQPNPADPEQLNTQGADLTHPAVIIQGITLVGDSLFDYGTGSVTYSTYPDLVNKTNLYQNVTVLVRPSVICLDPRHPDRGGVLVTPGTGVTEGKVLGPYPTSDKGEGATQGVVVDTSTLSNPQLTGIVNHAAAGTTNGLMVGCLPTGRYAVNVVYPTGQAWTTPNEIGSCAATEGSTTFSDPNFDPGSCTDKPRKVLYSQGTRAVVEITPTTNPNNCKSAAPTDGSIPAVPALCTAPLTGN
jgi:hypothetical protein